MTKKDALAAVEALGGKVVEYPDPAEAPTADAFQCALALGAALGHHPGQSHFVLFVDVLLAEGPVRLAFTPDCGERLRNGLNLLLAEIGRRKAERQ